VDQSTSPDLLVTGIKVIDLICPFLKGGRSAQGHRLGVRARRGANVAVANLDLEAANTTAKAIRAAGGEDPRACVPHMYKCGRRGSIIYLRSHSKEAAPLKARTSPRHGRLIGLAKVVAKEGCRRDGVRADVISSGFVRTPLVATSRSPVPLPA
jgi:hypothetical protein